MSLCIVWYTGLSYYGKEFFLALALGYPCPEDEEKVVEPSADAFRHALSRVCCQIMGVTPWTKLQMERNP